MKANILVLVWTKNWTKLFFDFCPKNLKWVKSKRCRHFIILIGVFNTIDINKKICFWNLLIFRKENFMIWTVFIVDSRSNRGWKNSNQRLSLQEYAIFMKFWSKNKNYTFNCIYPSLESIFTNYLIAFLNHSRSNRGDGDTGCVLDK